VHQYFSQREKSSHKESKHLLHSFTQLDSVNTQIVSAGREEGNRRQQSAQHSATAEEGHDLSTHVMNDNLLI